jgi:putative spermidine/putrescine transport system ATP-binding protein
VRVEYSTVVAGEVGELKEHAERTAPPGFVETAGVPVELHGVSQTFNSGTSSHHALIDLDLAVEGGEFLTLLGPSGSGKTTALQIIAGLQRPSTGRVRLGGQDVTKLPPHKRDIGVVFQGYALFPHLSVAQNVAFPLRLRKASRREIDRAVGEALALVQLGDLADRMPSQLSGGQQQRVAIARALVFNPRVLLMDEPLGALDRQLRDRLQLELRQLQKRVGITCVYVTHDQEEAMLLSDRIAILKDGRLQQVGTAEAIYRRPENEFVGTFVGRINLWSGRVVRSDSSGSVLELAGGGRLRSTQRLDDRDPVRIAVRPEAIGVSSDPPTDPDRALKAEIHTIRFTGSITLIQAALAGGDQILVQADSADVPAGARTAWLTFAPDAVLVFTSGAHGTGDPSPRASEKVDRDHA